VSAPPAADAEWNAGDLGCGDLVLELRTRMGDLSSGQVLRLVALDPGAPADIPAWCRMTGHTLLLSQQPVYFIRRKEN
jgi:tRNA 2-thiouridine synthesizing protein A